MRIAPQKGQVVGILANEGIFIMDRSGKRRASLVVGEDGSASLLLKEPYGHPCASINVLSTGETTIQVLGKNQQQGVVLSVSSDGNSHIKIIDRHGKSQTLTP